MTRQTSKMRRIAAKWCVQTLALFPVYFLAMLTGTPFLVFTVVCLATMCMVMTVIINDRNKEIYDLSQILEEKAEDAKQRRIRPARDRYRTVGATPSQLRIGDVERDQVMGELGDHYAAGRLTRDELDDRMNTAIHSKTAVDLATLLKDLP